jgi:hypothetical protein
MINSSVFSGLFFFCCRIFVYNPIPFFPLIHIESFTYLILFLVLNNGKHHDPTSDLKSHIPAKANYDNDVEGSNESNDDATLF